LEKKDLIEIVDNEFKPQGYKRKGSYWKLLGERITKIIQLQRSSYSKLYYVNYGFNFVHLNYDEVPMHIRRRLGSLDKTGQALITNLLDFENDLDTNTRRRKLADIIKNNLSVELGKINSEKDVLDELTREPILLNTLPLKVKEYLNLEG